MDIQIVAIIILLSLLLISLLFHWKQLDRSVKNENEILRLKEELEKKPKKQQSLELQEFLGDMIRGDGLVRVERIDPSNVFLHTPSSYKN